MSRLRPALRALLALALVVLGAAVVPRVVCGWDTEALYAGALAAQDDLARAVAASAMGEATAGVRTGDARFDGEWALVTQQMTLLGLGQVALAHPTRRVAYLPVLERCAARLLTPEATAFGTSAWREQGLHRLDGDSGHAYLGYLNLALGMLRLLKPDTRSAALHDRLTEALARRLAAAPYGLIDTYPGEAYPADTAMVAASIALHDQAVAGEAKGGGAVATHRAALQGYLRALRAHAIEPRSGLLYQRVNAQTGIAEDEPRASGTALAVYALSFLDRSIAQELFSALQRSQPAELWGFGGLREYPPAQQVGGKPGRRAHQRLGDIDSGPLLLGISPAATGFALAGARLFGQRELFTSLYRTAELFGAPVTDDLGRRFLSGGPLGNAVLLAMLTATWERGANEEHSRP